MKRWRWHVHGMYDVDGTEWSTSGVWLRASDHEAEVERLRSELASEREARERAEGAADAVLRAGIGIIHGLDAAGVPRVAGEFPGPLENLSARVNDLRQRLEHVVAENADLRARLEQALASEERLAEALANLDGGVDMARVVAILDETRGKLERAEAERDARPTPWSCDDCGFVMSAEHTQEDGSYSCPCCSEAEYQAEAANLRARLEQVEAALAVAESDCQAWKDTAEKLQATYAEEVASLKRELAAAQAVTESDERLIAGLWATVHNSDPGCNLKTSAHARLMGRDGANAVFKEVTVDYQNGERPGIYPVVTPAGGTSALDSYVADATAALRKKVVELEAQWADVCDVAQGWVFGRGALTSMDSVLSLVVHSAPTEALAARLATARVEGERAGEERMAGALREAVNAVYFSGGGRDYLNALFDIIRALAPGWLEEWDGDYPYLETTNDALPLIRARPSTKEEDGHAEDAE